MEKGRKYVLEKVVKKLTQQVDDDILLDDTPLDKYAEPCEATFRDVDDDGSSVTMAFASLLELRKHIKRFDSGAILLAVFREFFVNTIKQKFAAMAKERPGKAAVFNFSVDNKTIPVQVRFFDDWDKKVNEFLSGVPSLRDKGKAFSQAVAAVKRGFLGDEDTSVVLMFAVDDEDEEEYGSGSSSSNSSKKTMKRYEIKKFEDWGKRVDSFWWSYGVPDEFVVSYINNKLVN